jgi:glycosidase
MLGTNEDFSLLCSEAEDRGIRILLDGVFNHTGFDSIYFNGVGRYPSTGAYQSENSPYYSWYTFRKWPDDYVCWWDIKTLPKANANDSGYADFIAGDKNSVIRRWLAAGASGWRLDVADEIPDLFIRRINRAARSEKDDAIIIGEVWEDASNKISYGARRDYLLGGALDGVMNYPFRDAAIDYLKGGSSADFRENMESLLENYPPYAVRSAMNILGTHDTPRILSILGVDADVINRDAPANGSIENRAELFLDEKKRKDAKSLLRIGALLQFCFVGCPCIYYGDEAGLEGFEDPLNRRGFPWGKEDRELTLWYKRLGEARKDIISLRLGSLEFLDTEDPVIAFTRKFEEEDVLIACNRADASVLLKLQKTDLMYCDFMSGERITAKSSNEEFYEIELMPKRAYLLIKVE